MSCRIVGAHQHQRLKRRHLARNMPTKRQREALKRLKKVDFSQMEHRSY